MKFTRPLGMEFSMNPWEFMNQGGDAAREPMVSAEPLTARPSAPGWRTRLAVGDT